MIRDLKGRKERVIASRLGQRVRALQVVRKGLSVGAMLVPSETGRMRRSQL